MAVSASMGDDPLLDEALGLVVRMHSGEPSAPSAKDLEEWAGQSQRHGRAAAEARALWVDTGALRQQRNARGGMARRVFLLGGVGVLGAGALGWHSQQVPGQIATGTAETRRLDLADGSHIELSARSGLDLDPGRPRRADLRAGQAWFDIQPGEGAFQILAGGLTLEIAGGEVDLDIRAGEGRAMVSLGSQPARLQGRHGQFLAAHSMYRLTPDRAPELLARNAGDASAWRTGKLVAEEIPLADVVAVLNDWYPGWIRISSAALAELPVTAVLDLRRPEAALRSLEHGLPIRIRNIGGLMLNLGWA